MAGEPDWRVYVLALLLVGGAGVVVGTERGRRFVTDLTKRGRKLTTTTMDGNGNVPVTPEALARRASILLGRTVSADAYALARMIRSEEGSAPPNVKKALAWVAMNDARELGNWSIAKLMTYSKTNARRGFFGTQLSRRYSTARDPYEVDLGVAELVLHEHASGAPDPTGGAVKFVNKTAFGVQKGTRSYEAVARAWAADGLQPVNLPGLPAELVFFRRGRRPKLVS